MNESVMIGNPTSREVQVQIINAETGETEVITEVRTAYEYRQEEEYKEAKRLGFLGTYEEYLAIRDYT